MTMHEIPIVGDMSVLDCEYDGACLKLVLEQDAYVDEQGGTEPAKTRAVCFIGVQDIDARPPFSVQADYRPGCVALMFKVGSLSFNFGYPEQLKTAAQLMQHIQAEGPAGEVLLGIEGTSDGFIVKTLLGRDYYVPASSVVWCDSD